LDQAILFHPGGDPDYLPQVTALAHLEFGETSVREMAGRGVRSFPFASVLFHAAWVRLLGDPGFVVADILAFLLYGWALSAFLQNAGITRRVAEVITLLVLSGALRFVLLVPGPHGLHIPVEFWYPRFARPLITEFFVVVFFSLAIRLINDPAKRNGVRSWALLGVLEACLMQSDIYQAMNLALVASVLVLYLLIQDAKVVLRGILVSGGTAAVICTPFVYQRLHASPEVLRRWGLFASGHRLIPLGAPLFFVFALSILIVEMLLGYRVRETAKAAAKTAAFITGAAVLASLLSGPLSLLVLGKGLQVYHFVETARLNIGYAMLLCAGWVAQDALARLGGLLGGRATLAPPFQRLAFVVAVMACLAIAAGLTRKNIRDGRPTAATMRMAFAPQPSYKSFFAELHSQLMRPEYQHAQVLGTFDVQLAEWWEYRSRFLYLPDNSTLSTVSDREIEERVSSFLRLMEATPDDFNRLLDNWYFLVRVLAGGKYLANSRYTPWPINDYSPDAQRRIAQTPIVDPSWHLELPVSERRRLLDDYAHFDPLTQPCRKLDVVVLSRNDLRRFLHPEKGSLSLVWSNDSFEIWVPGNEGATHSAASHISPERRSGEKAGRQELRYDASAAHIKVKVVAKS
jgi:hypothetical protein